MVRRSKQYVAGKFYRINENIRALRLRVVHPSKGQLGIMSRAEAVKLAREKGLDLVEVAPAANPPVAKLIDFAKFKYEQAKKRKNKKGATPEMKQLRFRPFMEEHDIKVRIKKIEKFLHDGNRVKIQIRFFGRELTKKDFGFKLIEKIINELNDQAKLVNQPKFKGNVLEALIGQK